MSLPAANASLPTIEPEMTDLAAVRGVVNGEKEMFRIIVRRYNPVLYRVGISYLRDHARAEDAMQNTYLKAFQNLSRFRGSAAFATWLTRIMINECLMTLRHEKHLRIEPESDLSARDDESPSALDALQTAEIKAVLEHAIQTLPRARRVVYVLREVQRLSTAETAACLGLSSANVKVRLHRAREELKAQLLRSAAGTELFDYPATRCDPMTARVMELINAAP
ncbi:MAG TPA: sigma-70 family RNA polymerase sigma factor [Candidatus Didemnitutus sp.]|jgi:RNA polymerase sigma-70 factor (ECF subfamily)